MTVPPLVRQMLETELVDLLGREAVLTDEADRLVYGVDNFWVPRMLVDRARPRPFRTLWSFPPRSSRSRRWSSWPTSTASR